MDIKLLSIIIPVFNEESTLEKLISSIESVHLTYEKELIFIDDGSTDRSREVLEKFKHRYKILSQPRNKGKGSAIRLGFAEAIGDVILVQDADLEYSPQEYKSLVQPIIDGLADVVYGSRFVTVFPRRVLYFWHYVANTGLTLLSNILTGLNLSDMETGYKVFTRQALKEILPCLQSQRFGIEPELTAQIAKHKFRVYEIGISYHGRTYEEGKKIGWKDGVAAIWHIVKFNIFTKK
ncbi:MAG: Glycosyltransferase [Candidatus Yanofskybacteria bacterium GW2011_GWD2_39_48]|uniref:Glycosyltransferase n=1 Tax=Candidatus Yanofskybacteria bacterium GW2011_GWD2_39_48 TaxID=1619031 RepID=A0A0G0SCN8_9BACT|nr:MAG: Glycosyltransferase [Candidatus Yanofskybacteria bacterium GW2011_GWD2_39_48]